MLSDAVLQTLDCGLKQLPFPVLPQQKQQLTDYLILLNKWNQVHNLTAVRNPQQQVIVHLLDSLAVLPYLTEAESLADIGSGAGLPAIVFAVMRPDMRIYAVESYARKSAFIRRAALSLGLKRLTVISMRVEAWQYSSLDVVISRALASAERFVALTRHLGDEHTRWLIMKARKAEPFAVPGFSVTANRELNVPLLEAQRSLIEIRKTAALSESLS